MSPTLPIVEGLELGRYLLVLGHEPCASAHEPADPVWLRELAGDEVEELAVEASEDDAPRLDFIEIVLLDEAGHFVPDEPFELELPDGTIRSGRVDEHGFAEVRDIPPGPCNLRFPGLDRAEVRAA